ncbi:MAG TPA: tetratricopeptide repeat protein [Phycisphaerales bacterium]|nr:tetratricopeptide repeat protein [Phycisphaerales bacterium]HRQ74709.1 tetratricopeptide repeat protein [Phycisphaerales bacterium]
MPRPERTFLRSSIVNTKKWKQQLAALRESLERAKGSLELARTIGQLGDHLRLSPDHIEEAISTLLRSLKHAEEAGDPGMLASNMIRLAVAQQYAGNHRASIGLHRSAIILIQEHNVCGLADFALQHLGKCYAEFGKIDEAAACFSEALRLREQHGDEDLINSTREAIAHLEQLQTGLTDA